MKKTLLSLAFCLALAPLIASAYWYAIGDGSGNACNVVNFERSKAAAKTHNKPYEVLKTHTAMKEWLQGMMADCDVDAAGAGSNVSPTTSITAPANSSTFTASATITFPSLQLAFNQPI